LRSALTSICLGYFFTEFGPNTTTFVYPAEIFPMEVRTTAHGIASATGKLGAFIGTFTLPLLLASRSPLAPRQPVHAGDGKAPGPDPGPPGQVKTRARMGLRRSAEVR